MRIWRDPSGALVDDQRLLAYVSTYGSLSEALKSGDFVLVTDSGESTRSRSIDGDVSRRRRLADYIQEDEGRKMEG